MARLLYNVQRSCHTTIGRDVLKIILLRGIRDDFLDMLNLLGKEDISKESFDHIVDLCRQSSRGYIPTSTKDRYVF